MQIVPWRYKGASFKALLAHIQGTVALRGEAAFGGALHYLLGETVAATEVLRTVVPSALLAAVLVLPVLWVCRLVLGTSLQPQRTQEVGLV